jgi:SAM-dependent methyltransferase
LKKRELIDMDLAGRDYWERVWHRSGQRRVEHLSYFNYQFTRILARYAPRGSSACEIGCGNSSWLPFLASRGVKVSGIDYSDTGLRLLRERLEQQRADAQLVCGDALAPAALPPASFDLVFSVGFIEHFDDGCAVVRAVADYVKPGGVLVTLVPNLVGIWGPMQKRLDPAVYNLHTLYTAEALDAVHVGAGLEPISPAAYIGGVGACSLNYSRLLERWPLVTRWVMRGVWVMQQAVSWPAALLPGGGESRAWSAFVVGAYRRPVRPPSGAHQAASPVNAARLSGPSCR